MVSLLLIGLGLITGVMTRLAAAGGIIWMATFYLGTAIWPEHNPFVDDHFVFVIVWSGLSWRTPPLLRPRQGLAAGRLRAGSEVPVLIDRIG